MKLRIRTETPKGYSLEAVFSSFIIHKAACNNSQATLNNYQDLLRTLRKYIDVTAPLEDLTKKKLDGMVVLMRQGGLANNSIATYVRITNTFLAWCREEGLEKADTTKASACHVLAAQIGSSCSSCGSSSSNSKRSFVALTVGKEDTYRNMMK